MFPVLLSFFLIGPLGFADASSEQIMQDEIAKANDVNESDFESVTLTKDSKGIHLRFRRVIGDGGQESCEGKYRLNRTLAEFNCNYDYTSHSMGPENKRFKVNLKRAFDDTGKLKAVSGTSRATSLKSKKVVEDRKITSVTDDKVNTLSKPVLKLPESIQFN